MYGELPLNTGYNGLQSTGTGARIRYVPDAWGGTDIRLWRLLACLILVTEDFEDLNFDRSPS